MKTQLKLCKSLTLAAASAALLLGMAVPASANGGGQGYPTFPATDCAQASGSYKGWTLSACVG